MRGGGWAAGDGFGLGDGEELAAGKEREAFAPAVGFAEGEGDFAVGVAVPEGEAADLLTVVNAGSGCA